MLELTWEQVWFVAECVLRHKAEQINLVAEPVLTALGGRKRKRSSTGSKRDEAPSSPEGRDAALLRAIGAAGLTVAETGSG